MQIENRQRVTVSPVARAKVPFEIRRPQIIRRVGHRRHDAGVFRAIARPTALDQPVPIAEIAGGAHSGPRYLRMARRQPVEDFARSPVGMLPSWPEDQVRDDAVDAVRATMRSSTPIAQAGASLGVVAVDPLVAGLPTDLRALAQHTETRSRPRGRH